jgi:hypothetical protein
MDTKHSGEVRTSLGKPKKVNQTPGGDTIMSETYFPNHNGMPESPQDNRYFPNAQPRSYDHYQPGMQPGFGPDYGNPGGPPFGVPSQSGTGSGSAKRVPLWLLAVLVVLTILTAGSGGYLVVTNGHLKEARTEVAARSDSLAKANDSLRSTQADLDKTKQQLAATGQQAKDAMTCATLLQQAWVFLFDKKYPETDATLGKAQKACEPVFAK